VNKIHGGNIYEIAKRFGLNQEEIIDFSASINPLGLSKKAEKKLRDSLSSVLHYPDPQCSGGPNPARGWFYTVYLCDPSRPEDFTGPRRDSGIQRI
jgi:hypothetical protein